MLCDECCANVGRTIEPIFACVGTLMVGCSARVRWFGKQTNSGNAVAITIDDFPGPSTTMRDVQELLCTLEQHVARATFFLVLKRLQTWSTTQERVRLVRDICTRGHEFGVHFEGSLGCARSDAALYKETRLLMTYVQEIDERVCFRVVRPAGGWSKPSTIAMWREEFALTTVVGTAYPVDHVDCLRLLRSERGVALCAFKMASRGNRIVILHDNGHLFETMDHLLSLCELGEIRSNTVSEFLGLQKKTHSFPNTCMMTRS